MATRLLAPGELYVEGSLCILVTSVCELPDVNVVRTFHVALDDGEFYSRRYRVEEFTDVGFADLPPAAP